MGGDIMMADDMIALDLMKRDARCPWFPQFKLWPDAAVAARDDPEVLPTVLRYEKRARHAVDRFSGRFHSSGST